MMQMSSKTYGCEAHTLDVVQVVDDALPRPSAVESVFCIASSGSATVCAAEPAASNGQYIPPAVRARRLTYPS